ncbi:MAG: hypothetical protein CBC82_10230 [Cellvibrionales bacterium TMED122]|nr:MAG: hypothetical protein CBC82_10230 [Cellvibrionales bacterium TMED122]
MKTMKKMKKLLLVTAVSVATASMQTAVRAQAVLEEVMVTAARKEQSLLSLPISATVFSADDARELRILEPRDLADQTPGLLTKNGPNGLATVGFYMRGVGINDFTGTVDPSVGVYVNDVFKPTPDMLNFAVYDVERIEVLRGPQGTLYGRNSTGGAVNFITVGPSAETQGYLRGEYGSFGTGALEGAIGGALSDTLQGRISFLVQDSDDDDGISKNRATDNELGRDEQVAIRGQLKWQPSDDFMAHLIYGYGDLEANTQLLQHVGALDPQTFAICQPIIIGNRAEGQCVSGLGYADTDGDFYDGEANIDPEVSIEAQDLTLRFEWQLGDLSLTSITGYDDFEKEQSQDIDSSPFVGADNFTFNEVKNVSQEIRLASDSSQQFSWIMGGNYANTEVDWFQTINLTDLAGIPTSNGAQQETESWAVFGQIDYVINDQWEIIGGLRYTVEERDWTGATFIGDFATLEQAYASGAPRLSQLPIPPGTPGAGGPLDFPTSQKENNLDFQAVVKYSPSDSGHFYAKVSEAFRSGGYSSAVLFSQEALEPFDPEELLAYEVGAKFALADNRVRLEASAFFYDFEGFQATFVRATEASARLQNAGDVEIYGMEGSLDWAISERFGARFGVSFLDSEIVETDVILPPLDGGPEATIEGNEIPNAPSFTFNGQLRYELPLPNGYLARFLTDFTIVDEHYLEPNNRQYLSEDGYELWNARVSLASANDNWEVAAWVRNIGDEEYRSAAQDLALSLAFSEIVVGTPRIWGVGFNYRF